MSSKTTWSLIAAAGVLFALIFFVERPLREARSQQANHRILPSLKPEKVTRISIRTPDQLDAICAERQDQVWRLTSPIPYPADDRKVETLIRALAALEWQHCISAAELKDRPQAQEEFGFVTPQFSIILEEGKTVFHLRVGTNSAWGDQVFLQVSSDSVFLANTEILKLIPKEKNAWRDTALVNLDGFPIDSVKIRSAGKTLELQSDRSGLWHIKTLQSSVQSRADSAKVEELLHRIQTLHVSSFVSDEPQTDLLDPYGLQLPELELSFFQGSNTLFSLQMGASPTNHPDQVYVRRRSPANIVLVPKEPLRLWQTAHTNLLDRHLLSSSPSLIDSIDVHGEDTFTLLRKDNGDWTVAGTETFPADPDLMRNMLGALTNAETETEQTVEVNPASHGMVPPLLQYALRGRPSLTPQTNLIAQIEFGTNQSERVFERRTDEVSVNTLSRDQFDRLPRASWQFRDRHIWSFASSNVVSVTVYQAGAVRKFIRDPDQNWTFAPGSFGIFDPFSLEETLHRLGELKAVYWSGLGETNLERFGFKETDHRISMQVKKDGHIETFTVEFGKASPYSHPYASVIQNGRRLIFEFPAQLYYDSVRADLTIPPSLRNAHKQ